MGLLEVTRRAEDVNGYAEMLRWEAGLFLLLAALAMGAVIVWGHQTVIGRPLAALTRVMERVEEGDRTHRADVFGPREIAELGAELNRMLDSIEEAESEIEQRRRAQISLERQLQQAEKLAAIGQLSAGIAHEIGSPLSVIEGKAQRALRRDDLSSRKRDTLQSIRRQVRRVEHVIHQLLEFGRHHEVDPRVVPAERLIRRCVNVLREKREERGVAIDVDGPSPAPDLWVDPALAERALTNLLRNALDASREGRVRLSWVETGEEIGIRVEDDGPGVDAEAKSRIFEPFFTTKKVGEGTGLGLAVARAIVEEHDGRIEVGDADLGGAAFTLYFEPAETTVSV